jgi:hypothetical protein
MKINEFNKHVVRRCRLISKVLVRKGAEYASSEDRLYNFKEAAKDDSTTPEKALWGMYLKHHVSVKDLKNGHHKLSRRMIDEKIGDAINYLILLEALLIEKIRGE